VGFADVSDGHRVGAAKLIELLDWCSETGVEIATFWLLSPDNLRNRPPDQLEPLLNIIADVVDELCAPERPWRVRVVGALDLLPSEMAQRLTSAAARTRDRPGLAVNVAVGYGGRQEIIDAIHELAQEGADLAQLDERGLASHLYTRGLPDPDLVIRTAGEMRLSNFLLWQAAYSEFYSTQTLWPDFRKPQFFTALEEYNRRHRRFGAL